MKKIKYRVALFAALATVLAACSQPSHSSSPPPSSPDSTHSAQEPSPGQGAATEGNEGEFPREYSSNGYTIRIGKFEKGAEMQEALGRHQDFQAAGPNDPQQDEGCYHLSLSKGKKMELCDIPDEEGSDAYRAYRLVGTYAELPYWFFFVDLYEGYQTEIVHQKTGQSTYSLPGFALSPDKKQLLTFHGIDAYGWAGIYMYQVGADSLKLLWEVEMEDWGPEAVGWMPDGSVLLKSLVGEDDADSQYEAYLRMEVVEPR